LPGLFFTNDSNCPPIFRGVLSSSLPVPNQHGVLCYAVQFGEYDEAFGANGLENAKQYGINTNLPLAGDFTLFRQLGDEVKEAIHGLSGRYARPRIVLLAHSRGGLAARAFLQTPPYDSPEKLSIAGLITTGTPHLGSQLGRVYSYLESQPRSSRTIQDWAVVDFLKDIEKTCPPSPFNLVLNERLDVRRPTIDYVSSTGAQITKLNHGISNLLKNVNVKYGQIRYTGVPLGTLVRADISDTGYYSVFDGPCHQLSDGGVIRKLNAKKFILRKGKTPNDYLGDGVVPVQSQQAGPKSSVQLLGSPGVDVLHKEETSRSTDISTMFCKMGFSEWLTPCQ